MFAEIFTIIIPVIVGLEATKIVFPKDLADMIRKDPTWKGQPIILGACNTGRPLEDGQPNFAQQPATLLDVDVTAPLDFTWYKPSGLTGSGPYPSGPLKGDLGPCKSLHYAINMRRSSLFWQQEP